MTNIDINDRDDVSNDPLTTKQTLEAIAARLQMLADNAKALATAENHELKSDFFSVPYTIANLIDQLEGLDADLSGHIRNLKK